MHAKHAASITVARGFVFRPDGSRLIWAPSERDESDRPE